jgi:hypothetical protein
VSRNRTQPRQAHIPSQAIEVEDNRFKLETTVLESLETVANPEVAADLGPTFADVTREGQIRTTQACMLVLFDLTLTDSFTAAVKTLEQMEAEMCGTPHMLIGCKVGVDLLVPGWAARHLLPILLTFPSLTLKYSLVLG